MPIVPFPITAEDFDGFKAQMLELMRVLYEENWGGVTLPTTTSASEIESGGSDAGSVGGGHILIMPWNYYEIIQGTWVLQSGDYINYYMFYCATNGGELQYKLYLAQGTYCAKLCYFRNDDNGIMKMYIDGVDKATFDCYGTAATNSFLMVENIKIDTSGVKSLNLATRSKNDLSSNYYTRLLSLCLFRTA